MPPESWRPGLQVRDRALGQQLNDIEDPQKKLRGWLRRVTAGT